MSFTFVFKYRTSEIIIFLFMSADALKYVIFARPFRKYFGAKMEARRSEAAEEADVG